MAVTGRPVIGPHRLPHRTVRRIADGLPVRVLPAKPGGRRRYVPPAWEAVRLELRAVAMSAAAAGMDADTFAAYLERFGAGGGLWSQLQVTARRDDGIRRLTLERLRALVAETYAAAAGIVAANPPAGPDVILAKVAQATEDVWRAVHVHEVDAAVRAVVTEAVRTARAHGTLTPVVTRRWVMARTGLTEKVARRGLEEAIAAGWLTVARPGRSGDPEATEPGKRPRGTTYRLTVPRAAEGWPLRREATEALARWDRTKESTGGAITWPWEPCPPMTAEVPIDTREVPIDTGNPDLCGVEPLDLTGTSAAADSDSESAPGRRPRARRHLTAVPSAPTPTSTPPGYLDALPADHDLDTDQPDHDDQEDDQAMSDTTVTITAGDTTVTITAGPTPPAATRPTLTVIRGGLDGADVTSAAVEGST